MSKKKLKNPKLPRNYTELGAYLAESRLAADFSQKDVSIELDYSSAQFISNFECGISAPPRKKLKVLIKKIKADPEKVRDLIILAETRLLSKELNIR